MFSALSSRNATSTGSVQYLTLSPQLFMPRRIASSRISLGRPLLPFPDRIQLDILYSHLPSSTYIKFLNCFHPFLSLPLSILLLLLHEFIFCILAVRILSIVDSFSLLKVSIIIAINLFFLFS